MYVLIHDGTGDPIATTARPWQRLLAGLRGLSLDLALAEGASPDASVVRALRAISLVRAQERGALEASARRILREAREPSTARPASVPVCGARIRACSAELEELIGCLVAGAPLSAQGLARASLLFTDAAGPIYNPASTDDLRDRLREAASTMSTV